MIPENTRHVQLKILSVDCEDDEQMESYNVGPTYII